MLEVEIIQEHGFRNVSRNGQIVGFQVRYRSCYYRSVWLSMSLGFDVSVDGESDEGSDHGHSRRQDLHAGGDEKDRRRAVADFGSRHSHRGQARRAEARRSEVEIGWGHTASYMPMKEPCLADLSPRSRAAMRGMMPFTEKRKIVLVV